MIRIGKSIHHKGVKLETNVIGITSASNIDAGMVKFGYARTRQRIFMPYLLYMFANLSLTFDCILCNT